MYRTRLLVPTLVLVLCPSVANADKLDSQDVVAPKKLDAVRAISAIVLDGRMDEAAWSHAPIAKDFIQNDPNEGEPATFDTEVKLLYDNDALYIGVFARDDQPAGIIVNELRKDFNTGTADGFQVVIDTFHDERNGYQFAINPLGAKWDAQMSNEGRESNSNWDGIWDVQTRMAEDRVVRGDCVFRSAR